MDYTARIVAEFEDKATAGVRKLREEVSALRNELRGGAGPGDNARSPGASDVAAQIPLLKEAGMLAAKLGVAMKAIGFARNLISDATEFNSLMETSRLSIAATTLTFREYRDERGQALSQQLQLNKAVEQGAHVQSLLRSEVFRSLSGTRELTEAYIRLQSAAGTQKATSEDLVRFTGLLSNYSAATGRSLNEVAQQMQMVLQGAARTSGVVGAFVRSLGISNEQLRAWRDQGVIIQEITERMEKYATIGEQLNRTWPGVMSNLQDISEQGAAAFARPWMDRIKEIGQGFIDAVTYTEKLGDGRTRQSIKPGLLANAGVIGAASSSLFESSLAPLSSTTSDILKALGMVDESTTDVLANIAKLSVLVGNVMSGTIETVLWFVKSTSAAIGTALGMVLEKTGEAAGSKRVAELGARIRGGAKAALGGSLEDVFDGVIKRIQDGFARIEEAAKKGAPGSAPGNGDPNQRDTAAAAIADTRRQWEELLATIDNGQSVAGLTGLEADIARVEQSTGRAKLQIDKFVEALRGDTRPGMGGQYEKYRGLAAGAKDVLDARAATLTADMVSKAYDQVEARLRDYAKFNKDTVEDAIEAERARTYAQIRGMEERDRAATVDLAQRERVSEAARKAERDTDEYLAKKAKERHEKEQKEWLARLLDERAKMALSEEQWREYADALTNIAVSNGENPVLARLEANRKAAKGQLEAAITVADGMSAALETIAADTDTAGRRMAESMLSTWSVIGQGFEDLVFSVITGRVSDLEGILSGMAEDILRDWTETLRKAFQQKASGGRPAGTEDFMGPVQGESTGSGLMSGLLGVGGLLLGGYGIASGFARGGGGVNRGVGSYIGAGAGMLATAGLGLGMAGGAGLLTGASTAAVAGSVVPIVGTVIGAVLGAVLGSLLSPSSEKKVPVRGQALLGLRGSDSNELGGQVLGMRDSNVAMMLGLGRASGAGSGFTADAYKALTQYIAGLNFEIHAGSDEHIQQNIETLLSGVIPKEMLHVLFGNKRTGGKEIPGIRGASEYDSSVFDAGAPIPKLLDALEVSAERIRQISQMIDTKDAEAFTEWLTGYVTAISGMKRLGSLDVVAEADKRMAQAPIDAFNETLVELKQGWDDLGLLFGDEQIKRGNELVQLTDEYFEKQIQYVIQLRQLQNSINLSTDEVIDRYSHIGESRDERLARVENEDVWPLWGQLYKATDPAEIERLVGQGQAAAVEILDILVAKLNEAQAIAVDLADVQGLFADFGKQKPEGMTGIRESVNSLSADIEKAAQLSGDAQIEALRKVGASAREVYGALSAGIETVRQNARDLNASIDQQIFGIKYDAADSDGKVSMLEDRLQQILADIVNADSPEAVKALTAEFQSLGGQYLSLFDANDPALAEARDWITSGLETLRSTSNEVYGNMESEFEAMAEAILAGLEGPIDATAILVGQLNSEIERWTGFLDDLRNVANDQLGDMIDEIETMNADLQTAIEETRQSFLAATTAIDDFSGTGTGSGSGGGVRVVNEKTADMTAQFGNTTSAAWRLEQALLALGDRVGASAPADQIVPAPRAPQPPATSQQQSSYAVMRRYGASAKPRTY